MKLSAVPFAVLLVATISACDSDDNIPEKCMPKSLRTSSDSIGYQYDSDLRLTALLHYSSKTLTSKEEITYQNGRLTTVKQSVALATGSPIISLVYTLEYGSDGLPSILTEVNPQQPEFETATEFTHDDDKRLVNGAVNLVSPFLAFKGAYNYTYNSVGNVTVVKYTVINGPGLTQEVTARENLTFDDKVPFYQDSEDLRILNVYVYRYIPNANNCLTSKVTYTSFGSYFLTPQDVTFAVTYDATGRVQSVSTNNPFSVPSFGGLLFYNMKYECSK